ncbi:L-threonylcarbamoyladenylate synthase [Sphingomonas flavalba]|uniref:L-threonylcarbamoyladenylate synthase n=1 Tax=Sphingomonas flavalba TaxID=2559804 RepID=UPI0039E07A23
MPAPATRLRPFGAEAIAEAAALIRAGQPVAVPTETVYGLAADATNGEAVARIYAAKGRPAFNPLIVHVADRAAAERIATFDATARALADAFWPGPLTLVLPLAADSPVAGIATAGLRTVALRCPAHRAMAALLAATGLPLAAPSANASGTISPTRAAHVLRSLNGRIAMVVDDGPTTHGIESTIVAVGAGGLRLLRPGPLTADRLADAVGLPVAAPGAGGIEAPGQMASHYAPSKPIRLNVDGDPGDAFLIGFGPGPCDYALSEDGDPVTAAARLFDALHTADAAPHPAIAVRPIPAAGLGAAINDRLRRAAAPR